MSILTAIGSDGEGEARRDSALNLLRVRRAGLIRECTAAALRVALDRGEVCAADVRDVVPIPLGVSPKLVGCVFRDLADAGILRREGFRPSRRPAALGRLAADSPTAPVPAAPHDYAI